MAAQSIHPFPDPLYSFQTLVIDLLGFARPSKEDAVRPAIVAIRTFKKRAVVD
jgi:hypothetical protein